MPADLVEHPAKYPEWCNPKAFTKMCSFQDKALGILARRGREFLDSIYEPHDLTCVHMRTIKDIDGDEIVDPMAKSDVGHVLAIANARADGSFEWEALELEYYLERQLYPIFHQGRKQSIPQD